MTGELLHTYTRKRLAAIARSRRVSGWHDMRKADLIKALIAEDHRGRQPSLRSGEDFADDPGQAAKNRQFHNGRRPSSPSQPRRLQIASRILLRSTARGGDRFCATAVSPHWIHAQWAVSCESLRRVERALGPARHTARPVLRLYDLSPDERLTHAVTFVSDTPIPADVHEWFVQADPPGGTYQLQLGILADDGDFHRLVSSDRIKTDAPRGGPVSPSVQQAPSRSWHTPPRVNGSVRQNELPLALDVELVIRGATLPQATVAIADEGITIESDGTFEHTLPLADGRQVIPTTVISPEGCLRRTVVVAIQRNIKHLEPQGPDDR